jgi:ribokinase
MDNPLFDVIVCGSLHLDTVVKAPALPMIDETVVGHAWEQICGGKGGNQAVQAARHGAKTAMIGRIGKDLFGETLLANLKKGGVDARCVSLDPKNGSGMSVAIQQDNGEYGAVIVSGSNTTIDAQDISEGWKTLGHAKVLVLQNEVPHRVNLVAAKCARASGAIVVFNAAPALATSHDLLGFTDVFVVNRVEAEALSGHVVTDRASAIAALPSLGKDVCSIIVTLGGGGLVVSEKSGSVTEIEALPVKVTSTHGAGDCFVGVLASLLANSVPTVEACRKANEAAAAFVSRKL